MDIYVVYLKSAKALDEAGDSVVLRKAVVVGRWADGPGVRQVRRVAGLFLGPPSSAAALPRGLN